MTDGPPPATAHGAHDHADDPRNADVLVNVNGRLVPRGQAVVSVFDAGFVLGDGVWEGLRVSAGHPAFLERHLDRLWEGAAAIALDIGRSRDQLTAEIYTTLEANGMDGDGVHVRLMVTRGPKSTPYQDPRMSAGPATLVIIAEYKDPLPTTVERGLSLFTVHVRRAQPDTLDPKLNSHSKLSDITACIQAYTAGAGRWSNDCRASTATSFARTSPGGARRERRGAPGGVVGAAQHLDRADALLGEPARHARDRRAVLRLLPE